MISPPLVIASFRVLLVTCLTACNTFALWLVLEPPNKKRKFCSVHRLSLISTLVLNLFYITLVWTPFSVRAFSFYIGLSNDTVPFPTPYPVYPSPLDRVERSVRILEEESHPGTWSLAFPPREDPLPEVLLKEEEEEEKRRLPYFIDIDCFLQDVVTSGCIFGLAYISLVKRVIMTRAIRMLNTWGTISGYVFLVVAVPVVTTFGMRYSMPSQAHRYFLHSPEEMVSGYLVYNIICDVRPDEIFLIGSFLEWILHMLVLLFSIFFALCLSVPQKGFKPFPQDECHSTEECSHDYPSYLATVWAWPLKPASFVLCFALFGRLYWTNTVSLISHLIVSISTVYLLVSTSFSKEFSAEVTEDHPLPEASFRSKIFAKVTSFQSSKILLTKGDLQKEDFSKGNNPPEESFSYGKLREEGDGGKTKRASEVRRTLAERLTSLNYFRRAAPLKVFLIGDSASQGSSEV